MVRLVNDRDAYLIFGAFEGTFFDDYVHHTNHSQVYVASFANHTTLSFGATQLDAYANPQAKATLTTILQQAVSRHEITAAEMQSILHDATQRNAYQAVSSAELAKLNSILAHPTSRYIIDVADFDQIHNVGNATETMMANALQSWGSAGSGSFLVPGSYEYLQAYAYIGATVNKSPASNRAIILDFLSGHPVTLSNGQTIDLNHAPTLDQLHQFLSSMRAWQGANGSYDNLRSRLDPLLDWMEHHPPGPDGSRAELPDDLQQYVQADLPEGFLKYAGSDFSVGSEKGVFALAYYDSTKNALVLEKQSIDPTDDLGIIKDKLFVEFDDDGKISSIEMEKDGETVQLNLDQLDKSTAQLQSLFDTMFPALKSTDLGDLFDSPSANGSRIPSMLEQFLTATVDGSGNLVLTGHSARTLSFDPRTGNGRYAIDTGVDQLGRHTEEDWLFNSQTGAPIDTGVSRIRDGQVEIVVQAGQPTTIRLLNSSVGIDFVDAAETIAQVFGRHFIGGGALVETITSAALTTLAANFGDALNSLAFDSGVATSKNISDALSGMDVEFLANLKASGVGALSSYLTAELIDLVGLHGFSAEAVNSLAGLALNQIIDNLSEIALGHDVGLFDNVGNLAQIGNVAGSFLGNELASEIGHWDEIGEQLGSSVGGSLGGLVGQALIPVPVIGAIIGSFLGNLLGGLIGGVFTGTPESGAIVEFDPLTGTFVVDHVWKEDGGSKRAAGELGKDAASALNSIVSYIGGELVNGSEIDAGSYGMRGRRFVYWEDGISSDDRVKFKEGSDLVEYGVLNAARNFQFLGGDVYAKRAFYNTMETAGLIGTSAETGGAHELVPGQLYDSDPLTSVEFGLDTLLGNLAIVDRLHTYLQSSAAINALIAAEPNSALAADWLLAFSRFQDLGLLHRNAHDWDGGFTYLLQKAGVSAQDVTFEFRVFSDGFNGERRIYLGADMMSDTIDSGSKTVIHGTDRSDNLVADPSPGPGHIANVMDGGDGDDRIIAGGSGDDLFGGSGDDLLVGGALDDWLIGGTGNDALDAGGGSGNVLSGDEGDDRLVGRSGSDWLDGGAGQDRLVGGGGDDVLEGGLGNDRIDGGEGNDTVIYRAGTGVDRISDTGAGTTDTDRLEFDAYTAPDDVLVVARSSGESISMFIGEVAAADRIDLRGISYGEHSGIDEFSFIDSVWSRSDLTSRAIFAKDAGSVIGGSADDDNLVGTIYDDTINGGAGTDILAGGFGSDVYTFNLGDGVDTIVESGFASDLDTLVFGTGIGVGDLAVAYSGTDRHDLVITVGSGGDQVILESGLSPTGENSIEQVLFADGTSLTLRDLLAMVPATTATSGADAISGSYGADVISAGNGADDLTGGLGDDSLDGGYGSDTYHYALGDGNDRIVDSRYQDDGATNVLALGAGITAADLIVARDQADENNVRISFAGHDGSILLDDQLYTSQYAWFLYDHGIDTIQFADGSSWSRADLITHLLAQASTADADIIQGTRFDDTAAGGDGNDIIATGNGADDLTGGLGDDSLDGGYGSDTYHYALGDGNDRVVDSRYQDDGATNVLVLGTGITAADLIVERDQADQNNVRISFAGHDGSILLDDQLYTSQYAWFLYDHGIDTIQFADGSSWSRADLISHLLTQGSTSGADIIQGSRFDDALSGGAGNDVLAGGNGDDTLVGGAGNDDLDGGFGSDTFQYAIGDDHDRIVDNTHLDGASSNSLVLGAGISTSNIVLERDYLDTNDVRISFAGINGSIFVDGQLLVTQYGWDQFKHGLETIIFANGTTWDRADIESHIVSAANSMIGTNGGETLTGTSGRDDIAAGGGDDILSGGAGSDFLRGGSGNDTYVYHVGDGFDTILDDSGTDTIQFGAGITPDDLILSRSQADGDTGAVIIALAGTNDRLLVENATTIERYEFADGTIWTEADLRAHLYAQLETSGADLIQGSSLGDAIAGGDGSDRIDAGGGNDTLDGGAGNDLLQGGSGDDTYLFGFGGGIDVIDDASGVDSIVFGEGIEVADLRLARPASDGDVAGLVISFEGSADQLYVKNATGLESYRFADGTVLTESDMRGLLFEQARTPGADLISGSSLGDTIFGGSGADKLYGFAGNDVLSGERGDDLLVGGSGDDIYIFNLGDGRDVVVDESGTDIVRFGPGVEAGDLIITRPLADGDTTGLIISIRGSEDQLYVKDAASIEQYQFSDGTVWSSAVPIALLESTTVAGTRLPVTMGDDVILGSSQDDIIAGLGGDDVLRGGTGSDTYSFSRGDGYDTIYEPVSDSDTDTLVFGDVTSTMVRVITSPTDPDDVVLFIDDDNQIYLDQQKVGSSGGIDRIEFSDGVVWTRADILSRSEGLGTTGDDTLIGTNFGDTIEGKAGNDILIGQAGGDTYVYKAGDGDDVILEAGSGSTLGTPGTPGPADDHIEFGSGITLSDIRIGHGALAGDVVITFAAASGSILLSGQNEGGGAGVEYLMFSDGTHVSLQTMLADSVAGQATSGADLIRGFFTADDISGGLGADILEGGAGSDRYHFNVGDGADRIVDEGAGGDEDALVLGAGIDAEAIALRRPADHPADLIIVLGGGDEIRLEDQLSGRAGDGIEVLRFNDGTEWSRQELLDHYLAQPATSDADYILGGSGDDDIAGLDGDDVIDGSEGNDNLAGGLGDDVLIGGTGEDRLDGGSGDDRLSGGYGQDSFDGGDGFDTVDYAFSVDNWVVDLAAGQASILSGGTAVQVESLVSIEGVVGGAGEDTLIGDSGDNRLEGSEGNDHLSGGAGDDIFVYRGTETGLDEVDGGTGTDRIEAAEDGTTIGLAALTNVEQISANGHSNVVLTGTDESDTLDLSAVALSGISLIYMADGDDVLVGSSASDIVDLGLGDDVFQVSGDHAADTVTGGDGNDRIEATADNTIIRLAGLTGVETISANGFMNVSIGGSSGGDTLDFHNVALSGIVVIAGDAGDDAIIGTSFADTLRGDGGDDDLSGGGGDDVFQYAALDNGFDHVSGGAGTDTIIATADNASIGLTSINSIEAISSGGFSGVTLRGSSSGDVLDFSGTTLTGIVSIDGGGGNDTLTGSAAGDTLAGGAGNDVLAGGGGNDLLDGGDGSDTYGFSLGGGDDVIIDLRGASGSFDQLVLGAGITQDDVRFSRSLTDSSDIVLSFATGAGSVTLDQQLQDDWGIDQVVFADGTIWSRSDLMTAFAMAEAGGTGANAAPVLDPDHTTATGSFGETANVTGASTVHSLSGAISFTDDDVFNLHAVRVVSVSVGGASGLASTSTLLGWLSLGTATEESGTTPGSIAWNFSAPDSSFDSIADGETATLTYLVRISDGHGGTVDQNVVVNVTGSNDAPTGLNVEGDVALDVPMTIDGSALHYSANGYQLTPDAGYANGAIWGAIDLAANTVWTTRIYLGAADYWGADGLGFAIAGSQSLATSSLGFGVFSGASIGIRFDTYANGDLGDPGDDFSQFVLNGNVTSTSTAFDTRHIHGNLENNAWHDLVIAWDAASHTLSYVLDGVAIASKSYDVSNLLLGGGTQAWFGFGAGTGGLSNYQSVEIDSITQTHSTLSVVENAIAGTLVGTLSGVDPDHGDTFTYTIVDEDGDPVSDSMFVLDGADLKVKTGAVIDYESATSHALHVLVTDAAGSGGIVDIDVAIRNVVDSNEAPDGLSLVDRVAVDSLTVSGSAYNLGDGEYRLTPDSGYQTGAVWGAIDLANDVTWTTRMFFGGTDGWGADGMAFALQHAGTSAFGAYGVLTSTSLGIKFDTYANSGEPGGDFTQFMLNGNADPSFDPFHQHTNLEDNAWHDVVIHWDASSHVLQYSIDGTLIASKAYDVAGNLFGGSTSAYFGFGAATGGLSNYQAVDLVSVESVVHQSVSESAASGTLIAQLAGHDPNDGDTLTYTIVDALGNAATDTIFEIDSGDQLRIKTGALLDADAEPEHDLYIQVADGAGLTHLSHVVFDVI